MSNGVELIAVHTADSLVSTSWKAFPFFGMIASKSMGSNSFQELVIAKQVGRHFNRHVFWVLVS